jgi:hypothetical protein
LLFVVSAREDKPLARMHRIADTTKRPIRWQDALESFINALGFRPIEVRLRLLGRGENVRSGGTGWSI